MEDYDFATVENGSIIGHVSTPKMGSSCTFHICTVEEFEEDWKDATFLEFSEFALERMLDSDVVQWGF